MHKKTAIRFIGLPLKELEINGLELFVLVVTVSSQDQDYYFRLIDTIDKPVLFGIISAHS